MKKILLPFIASALLCASCGNKSEATGDAETDSIEASAVADGDETFEEEEEPFSLEFKKYSKYLLYKADSKKDLYHENTISIEWPVSGEGLDVELLQEKLRKAFGIDDKNIEKYVENWVKNTFSESSADSYSIVKERLPESNDDSEDTEEEDEDGGFPMYDTSCDLDINYLGVDKNKKTLTFCCHDVMNNGCGLGSCIYMSNNYVVYDYEKGKIVKIDDIIANRSLAAKALKKQAIFSDQYGGLEGLANIDDIPDNFYFEGDTLVSVFGKYEISYGADGSPELGFDVRKVPNILTEYGKKLLNLE